MTQGSALHHCVTLWHVLSAHSAVWPCVIIICHFFSSAESLLTFFIPNTDLISDETAHTGLQASGTPGSQSPVMWWFIITSSWHHLVASPCDTDPFWANIKSRVTLCHNDALLRNIILGCLLEQNNSIWNLINIFWSHCNTLQESLLVILGDPSPDRVWGFVLFWLSKGFLN